METKLRILHLEDSPTDAEFVDRELKKGKIQFVKLVVGTKADFEKALLEFSPDIILSDHTLPSFDSFEAIRILKQKGKNIPFILVSATVADDYAVEIMKAGADDYILKDRLHRLPQAILRAMEIYLLKLAKETTLKELLASQLHLKEAQGIAKLGSWETDLQTFNVMWSDETHHIFETDPKTFQVTHESFLQFTHPDDRLKVNTALENSFNSPLNSSVEHRIISTKGTLKHVIENWKTIHDDKGHALRAVGTCQDITEQKLVAEEITMLSLVARKTSNAVIITDAEEKIRWVNDAFSSMTGYEAHEVIGKKPGTFLQGQETDPADIRTMHNKILNREAFECETVNYSKSGRKYFTRIQCQPEFDSLGELTGFFSIQTDITKEKEAEQAIHKLTERLTLATVSAKIGIWDWDIIDNQLVWDETMYQIFGVSQDKFSGAYEAWAAIVHMEDIATENVKVQRALSGEAKFDSEFRIVWPDKSIRYVKGDAIVVRDDVGRPLRMVGTYWDVTQQKLLEIQKEKMTADLIQQARNLEISNKELESFAFVTSHDLQEPLRMVTSFLGLIDKKYSGVIDEKGRQYIHFAVDGAKRMRQIIMDLLEFSRVGKTEEVQSYIDLNDIMHEVIAVCQKQIKETKTIVRFENLPTLLTYKTPLRQVFQNLVSNAIKYHKKREPPIIRISALENETSWQFSVKDNGIGIEEEYFDKIFLLFKRLHTRDEYEGTGMGLSICKKIVENFGGRIWLESEKGKGSTFYFTIPKKFSIHKTAILKEVI